jgi:hypothetical protein
MTPKARAIAVSAVVVAAILAGIFTLGSPAVQRQRRLDERRVSDLMGIENAVTVYWQRRNALPADLAALAEEAGLRPNARDPEKGAPYDYEVTGPDSYRLCAVFAFDSTTDPAAPSRAHVSSWSHGAGRHCFELRIPKEE